MILTSHLFERTHWMNVEIGKALDIRGWGAPQGPTPLDERGSKTPRLNDPRDPSSKVR
jgi:hypothetical protein